MGHPMRLRLGLPMGWLASHGPTHWTGYGLLGQLMTRDLLIVHPTGQSLGEHTRWFKAHDTRNFYGISPWV